MLRPRAEARGHYDDRPFPVATVATIRDTATPARSRPITPTTLRAAAATSLRSASGAEVELLDAAIFGVSADDEGALFGGGVLARLAAPRARFSVTAANLRVVDLGTSFRVDRIDDGHVAVSVLEGEVEVQSRVRLPVCFWPFDEVGTGGGDDLVDDAGGPLQGRLGAAVRRVPGLVGPGALRFDNTRAAVVTIVGGTAAHVGQGTLAMREGVSIEAVVAPEWSGAPGDYDEIYRKDDGSCRVLFSFQNDGTTHAGFAEPAVAPGACLSFGLCLAGRGYRELDMPLDGRDGRPTRADLADGRPHHVVATFDGFTGTKAIFIDGRLRFAHAYPVGSLILSGGPAPATIGNHNGAEPFTGVIDEVAIYDFALTAEEIALHHARIARGETAWGTRPPAPDFPRWKPVTRLVAGETAEFDQRTGLPR